MAVPILMCLIEAAFVATSANKTTTYGGIGTDSGVGEPVPIPLGELGARIGTAADRVGSRAEAAKAIGVSPSALQRYIKGDNEPPFTAIARLAIASGYSMTWIATGNGPESAPQSHSQGVRVDAEMLGKAVYVLDGVLRQNQSHMEPQDYAETLLMLVEYLRENAGGLSPGNVVYLMDFVRKRQRNGPRQSDPATGPES